MKSIWKVRMADGTTLTAAEAKERANASYFDIVEPALAVWFGIVDPEAGVLFEAAEAPLAYRIRVRQTQGGQNRGLHVLVFRDRIVWVFEDGHVVIGWCFGDRLPYNPIEPASDAEHAAIAHHLATPPLKMNFVKGEP